MRILVVEDDRLLNRTLCYNLTAAGYTIDSAAGKEEVRSYYCKKQYDLVVLDVNLPDGSGFDLCKEIKERSEDTPVVFLTARDIEEDQLLGFALGADDYVTKPFSIPVF